MRPRHADILKQSGCDADLDTFRRTLAEVKAEKYPDLTDEDLGSRRTRRRPTAPR